MGDGVGWGDENQGIDDDIGVGGLVVVERGGVRKRGDEGRRARGAAVGAGVGNAAFAGGAAAVAGDDGVGGRLTERRKNWARVLEKLAKEHSALGLQLQSRLALCQTVLDQLSGYAKRFLPFLLGIVIILRRPCNSQPSLIESWQLCIDFNEKEWDSVEYVKRFETPCDGVHT
jgi:hypothetical protein